MNIDTSDIAVWLDLNGERFQEGSTAEFTYKVPEFLTILSETTTLEPGDIILMGAIGIDGIVEGKEIENIARFQNLETTRSIPSPNTKTRTNYPST